MKPALALSLLLAACDKLPRDTDGALARVQAARLVRVGVVNDAGIDRRAVQALTDRIARTANAQASFTIGAGEPLLADLDRGRLDLVVGAFAAKTPWRDRVTLAPPIARYTVGDTPMLVRAAVKNGENRWAMLVERAARASAPDGLGE